jgi:hypothetical protein
MPETGASEMNEALSLWRSPLDKVALAGAGALSNRQPRCSVSIPYNEDFSAMTVYNYGYYFSPPATSESALAAMLLAMDPSSRGNIGSAAFIPQQSLTMGDVSYFPFIVPDQCNIFSSGTGGSGGSPPFHHFVIEVSGGVTFLSCSGSAFTTGGTYFQWLAFHWVGSTSIYDTCILAATGNCCATRCTSPTVPRRFMLRHLAARSSNARSSTKTRWTLPEPPPW